ncbi:hypothetical protein G6F52_014130 [Rhizopus delemar]|nr:hypothetical protein G6F52_014130 [Rhizopus delemar]
MPAPFSCQLSRAVRISTGMSRWAARHCFSTVKPSMTGSPRSSTTASNASTSPRKRADSPSPDTSTV